MTHVRTVVAQPFRAAIAGLKPCATFLAVLVGTATLIAQQPPDRSRPPALGPAPALRLPEIQKKQLTNGLPVWIVELHEVPVVQVSLVVFGGSAKDD